ncbi:TonB-dependent receptor domain-containing protein [Croceiramulus getboli]|nr:TonB-dependent receptor [Flavobacteriaceae bacterium YJPT1-3]
MKLKAFSVLIALFSSLCVFAQGSLSGRVLNQNNNPLSEVEVYVRQLERVSVTDEQGAYRFEDIPAGTYEVVVFAMEYELVKETVIVSGPTQQNFSLQPLGEQLSEVILTQRRAEIFALRTLKKVEGTTINAGKKSEVVIIDNITANLATNAPRQVYSQVAGLNIYENGDAGLQLNIGGRGLDPNRSANFNIRQNNYDISADVLGYPESYYTPPAEALREIQVIRGAASLQYGTQFGGLINFKLKQPEVNKKIALTSRQTLGSYGLFTSFNSLSGTVGKFSYYTYFNYKEGDGWRPNSQFNSRNYYAQLGYQISDQTKVTGELTLFNYLAKQPGGLTDAQFYEDATFSNRDRNWFDVDWKVYNLRLDHKFSPKTRASLNVFGLDATRSALGFRTNRVSQPDDLEEPRELLVDNFQNWGAEARFLTNYQLGSRESVLLLGSKYYDASNSQRQGPGSAASDPDFTFATAEFPNYERQSDFDFPNQNWAFFGENIFNLSERLSITPGFRLEYIRTESEGSFRNIVLDLAGNPLVNETIPENKVFDRSFLLLGTGLSYELQPSMELYGNISQNYRSVTFNDIRVVNPSFVIDENITDEEGYTADLGVRGRFKKLLSYDLGAFALRYNQRLGEVLFEDTDGSIKRRRGNIGDAFIYGLELFADWNAQETFFAQAEQLRLNVFTNLALTQSEYTRSEAAGVEGNEVEFIPAVNLKTGLQFGFKNLTGSIQYTYLSEQFTDASNAPQDRGDNQRGIEGSIPAYGVMDISLAYRYKNWKLETGLNNALDNTYFTRRATGYPGPGIIPAEPLTFYTTLQYKL